MRERFELSTTRREELIDITARVREIVENSGVENGLATVYAQGATAAIMIQENWDASVPTDVVNFLAKLIPPGVWLHDRCARQLVLSASSDPGQSTNGTRVAADDPGSPAAMSMRRAQAEIHAFADDSAMALVTVPLRGCRRALGTLVFVIATKYFYEIGSAESRRPHPSSRGPVARFLIDHSLTIALLVTGAMWSVAYARMDANGKAGQVVGNIVSEWTQILGLVVITKYCGETGSKEGH